MLVEFRVGNYLSFKEVVTFSMVAASIKEHKDTHVFEAKNFRLLTSAVIYGANASGKSNLFKALSFMVDLVVKSAKESQAEEEIGVDRFRLSTETDGKPSFFEITFIHEDVRYRYGFEVDRERVHSEWLFYSKVRETMLFTRENGEIELGHGFKREGKGLAAKTRKNALFLSVSAQWNGEIATTIVKSLFKDIEVAPAKYMASPRSFSKTINIMENELLTEKIMEFVKVADLGINEVKIEKTEIAGDYIGLGDEVSKSIHQEVSKLFKEMLENMPRSNSEVKTIHLKYNENGEIVSTEKFNMDKDESEGTKKLFSLIGMAIDTISKGKVLIIDELDAQLHPLLTLYIIKLFNSNDRNPNNAQLIFNTHDTNFLDNRLFRRDQIWFMEKNRYGATDLYSLAEYSFKVRKDESYGKNYIIGKYGAIPFLGDLETFSIVDKKENYGQQE
jgi:AAA15 family ATPase/GTPase